VATPAEARTNIMDAVLESYRKTAMKFLTAQQTEELLDEIIGHLQAEVNNRREHPQSAPEAD
jgi:hypothetical protein